MKTLTKNEKIRKISDEELEALSFLSHDIVDTLKQGTLKHENEVSKKLYSEAMDVMRLCLWESVRRQKKEQTG